MSLPAMGSWTRGLTLPAQRNTEFACDGFAGAKNEFACNGFVGTKDEFSRNAGAKNEFAQDE